MNSDVPEYPIDDNQRNLSHILAPVLLLTLIFFFHFLVRQMAGPLLPAVEKNLGISHTQSGLFVMCMGIGFFLSQMGAAYLAGKWGYRRCIIVSLWGAGSCSLLIGLAGSIRVLYFGFMALGLTGGLYVPSGIALITVLAQPRDWGKVMGIHELAPNMALISVPFLATAAIYWGSWRVGYLCMAGVLTTLGVIYFFAGPDAQQRPAPPDLSKVREIISNTSFWRLSLLLSLAVGVETGVYAMIPLFLVNERGFLLSQANQLLGMSRIPGLFMVLISGWLTDRVKPTLTVGLALAITGMAIIVLGIGPKILTTPSILLQAAGAACLFPPMLSLASGISTIENRALTISLILTIAPVLGSGIVPLVIAFCGDLGSFAAGLAGAGIITALGIVLLKS